MVSENGHQPEPENGHQPEEELAASPNGHGKARNAGFEESLGLDRGSGFGYGFNIIQEMASGSTKPEEWLPRSEFSDYEMQLRYLQLCQMHRERYGWTNRELANWHTDHMKMARNRELRKEIVKMVTGQPRPDQDPRRQSRFEQMAAPQNNNLSPSMR